MRCAVRGWIRLLPVAGFLLAGSCGITGRQFEDFLVTTALQVMIQSVFTVIGASIA